MFASTPAGGIKLGLYAAETLITKEWLGAFVRALVRHFLCLDGELIVKEREFG